MPPGPEVTNGGRNIRVVEIQFKPISHPTREPPGDVAVAAEIAIDLKCKGRGDGPPMEA